MWTWAGRFLILFREEYGNGALYLPETFSVHLVTTTAPVIVLFLQELKLFW